MPPYIQLVALDLMGTCLDDQRRGRRVVEETITQLRASSGAATPPDAEQFAWPGGDSRTAIRELCLRHGLVLDEAGLHAALDRIAGSLRAEYLSQAPVPVAGVAAAIADLRAQGMKVALLSQLPADLTAEVLRVAGWAGGGIVDAVVTVDDVPVGHPAPHMIHSAMALTGVQDVHRVLGVGNSTHDVAAARNSGGLSIGVLTGGVSADALLEHGADDVLDTAADLPHWIARARVRPPVPAA